MGVDPSPKDDGPLRVTYRDGTTEEWDRLWHHRTPMVTLFNTEHERRQNAGTRTKKGDEAKMVPVERIEEIEYLNYGEY